ncbi:MAG: SUF system Fe-S cluster assembly regulator, partial [Gammaproteobacteria bacterium]|nr:SUF system Fe-S cluster assembly regulator [Gammaproteobacteria bacterium]
IEGPIALTECSSTAVQCDQEDSCLLQGNWQRINQAVMKALEELSLTEMTVPVSTDGVRTDTLEFYRETPGTPPGARTEG